MIAPFNPPLFDVSFHCHRFLVMQENFTFIFLFWFFFGFICYICYMYTCKTLYSIAYRYINSLYFFMCVSIFPLIDFYTLVHILDIWCWCILFCCFFCLCHNLCKLGNTDLLLWFLWSEKGCVLRTLLSCIFHFVGN